MTAPARAGASAPRRIRARSLTAVSTPAPRRQQIAALFEASAPEPLRPLEPAPQIAVIREAPRPKLRISGEAFFIEIDEGTTYLRHPRWSLTGAGDSIVAAEKDLRSEARELVEVMSDMPPHSLDLEAFQLYRFVLRIA